MESMYTDAGLAAVLHDIGKANDGFQREIAGTRGCQLMYHDHITACLLAQDEIYCWLRDCAADPEVVIAAAGGHHLRFNSQQFGRILRDGERIQIHGFSEVVSIGVVRGLYNELPSLEPHVRVWLVKEFKDAAQRVRRLAQAFMDAVTPSVVSFVSKDVDEQRHRRAIAVRAALIVADAVGSGVPRTGKDIIDWIDATFTGGGMDSDHITNVVITPRCKEIAARTGHPFTPKSFQKEAASFPSRSLLVAPCGAGKTLAAWYWIAGQLGKRPARSALFLYPTRGTATEGFRDYVSWAPESEAALVHGTAQYDLEGMFENPDDSRHGREYTTRTRLFALVHWHKRIFSATVDTFLGVMAHQYGPTCLLPALADSVVVIDEVHSFDSAMFTALLALLEKFDVPVLCMTASLPNQRKTRLEQAGLYCVNDNLDTLHSIAVAPRYRCECIESSSLAELAGRAAGAGKRVLIVLNTVHACQDVARTIDEQHRGIPHYCYHSRFTLRDRKRRHEEVIALFRARSSHSGAVVISTQVCEMSLDLDADVLISQTAPVPALIQRMGRCCRVENPGRRRGEVYICEPPAPLPYTQEEIDEGNSFAEYLSRQSEISQAELGDYLVGLDASRDTCNPYVAFWNSGFWASGAEQDLRDGDDFCVSCVLDTHLEDYLTAQRTADPTAAGYVLPVPRSEKPRPHPALRYLMVADSTRYSDAYGYLKG